jgi:hypothetical protein
VIFLATWDIGTQTFRLSGKSLQFWMGREWLDVWKVQIVENRKDLALEVNPVTRNVRVVRRGKRQEPGTSRLTTDLDIVFFDLENGKTVAMELNEEINKMIRELCERGVKWSKGKDVSRITPFREL